MRITENFALAIRPAYIGCYDASGKNYDRWSNNRRGIEVSLHAEAAVIVPSERAGWEYLMSSSKGRDFIHNLSVSDELYARGIHKRGQLIIRTSEAEFEALEAEFSARIMEMQAVILSHLDARVRNTKTVPRRVSYSKGLSPWEVRHSAFVPHLDMKTASRIYARYLPSPIDPDAWSIRVRMSPNGPEAFAENQTRILNAFDELRARGIKVSEVFQGSWVDF